MAAYDSPPFSAIGGIVAILQLESPRRSAIFPLSSQADPLALTKLSLIATLGYAANDLRAGTSMIDPRVPDTVNYAAPAIEGFCTALSAAWSCVVPKEAAYRIATSYTSVRRSRSRCRRSSCRASNAAQQAHTVTGRVRCSATSTTCRNAPRSTRVSAVTLDAAQALAVRGVFASAFGVKHRV
ncbi:hypothetical protein KPB04_25095 [Burkholderia cenocepacia]|uniref:hypothetical protein n=1 Tax=Burkholderia cenocepacia TaxID=95486 RepID=UPI0028673F69|nr:hypothetical protein [Burkholderia cenocepacia]MDR8105006.1 hypothetical protein [Burkholderia cenocepacia]